MNLTYYSSATPDTMKIEVWSATLGASHIGTFMLVDGFTFSGIEGIKDVPENSYSLNVYPVPAVNELNVNLEMKKMIQTFFVVFDVSGKKVLTHLMQSSKEKVNISNVSNGNYLYHLLDE